MAVDQFDFTTGPSTLPDVGTLSYNGCTFSPLFSTQITGKIVKDDALRTTKLMEYRLSVDGYVTLAEEDGDDILPAVNNMRRLLQQQGGALNYTGRGFDLVKTSLEVAWGPVPELIEFQPLGGGRSAKVKWEVTFRTPDVQAGTHIPRAGNNSPIGPLLQFNYDTNVSYGEDYYSSMSVKGTMEILMNRELSTMPDGRTLKTTIDQVRTELDNRIFDDIDLSRFYVVKRDYDVSRDKRTMQFDVQLEEKPYMDMPEFCAVARGSYNVRPAKSGPGLSQWLCTLRATYTIRADFPRRWAWVSFLALLQLRMNASSLAVIPGNANQNPRRPSVAVRAVNGFLSLGLTELLRSQSTPANIRQTIRAWLIDFSFDEGLYKDSKAVTFSATWRLNTTFSNILLASGIWRKLPEQTVPNPQNYNGNLWAISMASVSGALGVMPNYLKPDIIIDFGY